MVLVEFTVELSADSENVSFCGGTRTAFESLPDIIEAGLDLPLWSLMYCEFERRKKLRMLSEVLFLELGREEVGGIGDGSVALLTECLGEEGGVASVLMIRGFGGGCTTVPLLVIVSCEILGVTAGGLLVAIIEVVLPAVSLFFSIELSDWAESGSRAPSGSWTYD